MKQFNSVREALESFRQEVLWPNIKEGDHRATEALRYQRAFLSGVLAGASVALKNFGHSRISDEVEELEAEIEKVSEA
jgi:hypothetical protein